MALSFDQGLTWTEKRRQRKAYSPDEARNQRGEWSSDPAGAARVAYQAATGHLKIAEHHADSAGNQAHKNAAYDYGEAANLMEGLNEGSHASDRNAADKAMNNAQQAGREAMDYSEPASNVGSPDRLGGYGLSPAQMAAIRAEDEGRTQKRVAGREAAGDWRADMIVKAVNPDQQIVYGWASVAEENGQLLVDKQDDVIMPEDLQKAAEDFVLYSRSQGDLHERKGVGRLVASLVTTPDICKAFGIAVKNNRVGWIVGFKVDDEKVWKAIKAGDRPEFSIGGKGDRVDLPGDYRAFS